MTDDRAAVFSTLRASLEGRKEPTPYPEYPADMATPPGRRGGGLDVFRARLAAANTLVLDRSRDLADFLRGRGALSGYCDPTLAPLLAAGLGPQFEVRTDFDRERTDDYQFGITRASAGIIETGSLVLTDGDTSDRLAAVAPWIHVACLDPSHLHATLAEAIAGLGDDPNVIIVSGYSQTADVEGIMIHGVHGPGVQACLLLESEGSTESDT